MRDMAENIGILDAHAASYQVAGTYNARPNGAHWTFDEIDLKDYHYPRKMLVCVSVGVIDEGAKLDTNIKSGDASGAITNTEYSFPQATLNGLWVYEYTPTRRFMDIECIVSNIPVDPPLTVTWCVFLVTDHSRWGQLGTA